MVDSYKRSSNTEYYLKVGGVAGGIVLKLFSLGCLADSDQPPLIPNTPPSIVVEAPKDGAWYSASFATNNQLKFPFKAVITDKEGGEIILEVYNEKNVNDLGCNPPIIRKELYLDPDSVFNFEEDTGLAGELKAGKTYHMRATLIDGELSPVVKNLIYHIKQLPQPPVIIPEPPPGPPFPKGFAKFMLEVYHFDITENYQKLDKFFPGKNLNDFYEEFKQQKNETGNSNETSIKPDLLEKKIAKLSNTKNWKDSIASHQKGWKGRNHLARA